MKSEPFHAHLPATMPWYQLMSQNSSVSHAISQWDKSVLSYRQTVVCHIKRFIVSPDNRQSSIKDGTPKKSRLWHNYIVL